VNPVTAEIALERELVELVESDSFAEYVDGQEAVETVVQAGRDPRKAPYFTIDRFTRERYAESAVLALESFRLLEFISGDRNISRTSGEELRPDVLAYNPEEDTIVVFELKKSAQTGRQALTELLAYEHELQNHLPLLGTANIVFVLISPEWSTLMDHALTGSVAWAGKTCIGLEVHAAPTGRRLKVHVPDAWAPLLSHGLPEGGLNTVTLSLYSGVADDATGMESPTSERDSEETRDACLREIDTALQVIARDGERAGTHGFAILCDNTDFEPCPWMILTGILNPFAFLHHGLRVGAPAGETEVSRFMADPGRDYLGVAMDNTLGRILSRGRRYLEQSFDPLLESFLDWSSAKQVMRRIAPPVRMEFWGVLGDFARDFVLHEAVRTTQMPSLSRSKHDWRSPHVGFTILSELTGERPFRFGLARCSDCFRLGVLIGSARIAYHNVVRAAEARGRWETLIAWLELDLVAAATEVAMMYRAASDIEEPPPVILLGERPAGERDEALEAYSAWFVEHYIDRHHPIHSLLFAAGLDAAPLFEPGLREWLRPAQIDELRESLTQVLDTTATACVASYRDLADPVLLSPAGQARFRVLRRRMGWAGVNVRRMRESTVLARLDDVDFGLLFEIFETIIVPLLDELVGPVFHRLEPIEPLLVDWEYLKQGIRTAPAVPGKVAAVIIETDGSIGTGMVDLPVALELDDPENEVLFMVKGAGVATVRVTTWARLAAGDLDMAPMESNEQ
jgi:hypothetical protein